MSMGDDNANNPSTFIDKLVVENKVVIFSKTWCPYCAGVKKIFEEGSYVYKTVELDLLGEFGEAVQLALHEKTKQKTVPNVFIGGNHIGGFSDVEKLKKNDLLLALFARQSHQYEFDALVIGGGSGGLAAAKEMARLGMKVALCDFVTPSPIGTTWGLGGTCVNVGCIPKKLMHRAALLHEDLKDASAFGWKLPVEFNHDWSTMVSSVQSYIKSLNWNYRTELKKKGVTYYNAFAKFKDQHSVIVSNKQGDDQIITADKILISVGCRPRYPSAPGVKDYCITSDDIFSLPYNPGKTLVVGASYVALECACFLKGINVDTTVMVRSILLRGFDRDMSEKVGKNMVKKGIKFVNECVIDSIKLLKSGSNTSPPELLVNAKFSDGNIYSEQFNTILIAVGRSPCTDKMCLENAGIKFEESSGKILVNDLDQTNVPSIYAIGDVALGRPELTPVAILAGKLLAKRIATNMDIPKMDYTYIPSTVFTSLEYGCVGATEEFAIEKYNDDAVIYHDVYKPLESVLMEDPPQCYAKLVCVRENGQEKVIGFHVLGPNAGEITQGFALAVKMGVSKSEFDSLVGIHPTCAEVFTNISINKTSGEELSDSKGC